MSSIAMQPDFDISQLLREAQRRWLKPLEVQFILLNHDKFEFTQKPQIKPPSGSLFLFNKRVNRFFRNDGHVWRKKKDGRAIGEAHERLKVGSFDALHCYYAHGELNPFFQRRCYWMLDRAREHIVLVHYLEVEGRYDFVSNMSTSSSSNFGQSGNFTGKQSFGSGCIHEPCQSSSPVSVEEVTSKFLNAFYKGDTVYPEDRSETPARSSQLEVRHALRKLEVQLSLDDDDNEGSSDKFIYADEKQPPYSIENDLNLLDNRENFLQERTDILSPEVDFGEDGNYFRKDEEKQNELSYKLLFQTKDNGQRKKTVPMGLAQSIERNNLVSWNDMLELNPDYNNEIAEEGLEFVLDGGSSEKSMKPFPNELPLKIADHDKKLTLLCTSKSGSLPLQLDNQLGVSIQQPSRIGNGTMPLGFEEVTQYNSGKHVPTKEAGTEWMGNINAYVDEKQISAGYSNVLFDQEECISSLCSSGVIHKKLFNIREVTPEWAFSSQNTKVIIMGDFLCDPGEHSWTVMFGDVVVPLEIIQEGILCCWAPQHVPGTVTLCITSGNRESCSEVREFEYFAKPQTSSSRSNLPESNVAGSTEELLLLVRFVQTLLSKREAEVIRTEASTESRTHPSRIPKANDDKWQELIESLLVGSVNPSEIIDWLLQELLKDKLQQWLSQKCQDRDGTDYVISKQDNCTIHELSGLGFTWALHPVLSMGMGINFRDDRGWTALHWAAHFGREKMVASLLAAGASATAVTDPTSHDPDGKMPSSIASMRGYKGLAGYLSEVELITHDSSLRMKESKILEESAVIEAEKTVEDISDQTLSLNACEQEDQLSLKDSLAAVRNAALAAARIQSAFRTHSFRKRQEMAAASCDQYNMTPEKIHELSCASRYLRVSHGAYDLKFNVAALCIQKKFRGWKGRKKFLALRKNVVKIQAHVRGHQARKKYRLVWTVGIVEKAILRWRRKGVGLRGFRAESESMDDIEEEDVLKVFRKQKVDASIGQALSRVLSMAKSPPARQQYRRVLESYHQAKAELMGESASSFAQGLQCDDDEMYQLTMDETCPNLEVEDIKL